MRMLAALVVFGLFVSAANVGYSQIAPLPEHSLLKKDVGVWKAEMKMWMNEMGKADPAATPMESSGEEVNRMVGPFWVAGQFKADFGGMEFEGTGTNGYDPKTKKYIGSWVDSMNPHAMHMQGTYDETTKILTSYSQGTGMDGKEVKGKSTMFYKDADTRIMTMYELKEGTTDEYLKSMEIIYTRKK